MYESVLYRQLYSYVATILVGLVFDRTHSAILPPSKMNSVDVFDVLLDLYKINPLKGSKVYTKFANNVLTQSDKKIFKPNISSDENQRVNFEQLSEIEKILHPSNKQTHKHSMEKPQYDVESVDSEKFNVDVIVGSHIESDSNRDAYARKSIINGIVNNYPRNKMPPPNPWLLLPNPVNDNQVPPPRQWYTDLKEYTLEDGSFNRFLNKYQEPSLINADELPEGMVI